LVPAGSTTVQTFSGVATTTTADSNPNNNTATAPTALTALADVFTQITLPAASSASVVVSGSVIFGNLSALPAFNVGGTVTFSAGVQVQTLSPGAVTATVAGLPAIIFSSSIPGLGTVTPGSSTTFAFTLRTPGLIGTYSATSTVATTTPEVSVINNVAVTPIIIDNVPSNAVLSGRVYQDLLRNKVFDLAQDLPIANFRVELVRVTGTNTLVIASATTAVDGTYRITDLTPGTGYAVRFFDGSGSIIFGTPLNQQSLTLLGNVSTGSNALTSAITQNATTPLSTLIENITLYAGDNVQQQNLPLDPSGVVYDSVTRKPLAGATVKLVYEGSGVFNPANQTLEGTDTIVTGVNGMYQYLFINNPPTGVYRLEVTPPPGYQAPQAALGGVVPAQGLLNANLGITVVQPLGTAPAVGVTGGAPVVGLIGITGTQYYLRLQLNFPGFYEVINNHIPLDALNPGALLVSKTGNKTVAEIGDSIQYTVRIRNTTLSSIGNIKLSDLLPAGFRYILGTTQLGGVSQSNPAGGLGRELTFDIGAIAGQATAELTYFVRLGVGSQQGDGINRATVIAPIRSNTAVFKVNVQGGVFTNEGCITGKVYVDCDGNAIQNNVGGGREVGIPGVRLVMLDGTFVITDSEGKYSICGVKSQTHVVKVDRTTLPKGSRLVPSSNRNAGVGDSLFVDLKGGELARADFIEGSCSPEVLDQVKARRAQGGVSSPDVERITPLTIENRTNNAPQQILPAMRQQDTVPAGAQGVR
jgi:large repetitive protein